MGREVVVAVTNGRLDGFAGLAGIFGTWERILGVSWIADTGVLTAGGGNGCWSRLSGSSGNQSYPSSQSQTLSPGLEFGLELGGRMQVG
jgi:hypothetical protein